VAKNRVLLLLALFAYVPAGFAQARQEVTEPGILVNGAAVEFSILPRKPEVHPRSWRSADLVSDLPQNRRPELPYEFTR
jgi:hypothetical protein